jgi:hypothetical protein
MNCNSDLWIDLGGIYSDVNGHFLTAWIAYERSLIR